MPTEQASFDALLAGEIPEGLREALTTEEEQFIGLPSYVKKRVPLPLDSAIVAAIRWATVEQGWLVHFDQGGVEVHRPVGLGSYHRLEEHYGPDIFSAIGAAFKETK